MTVHVVLLRAVNLVKHNRVPMPRLRSALEEAGFGEVRTHLQSGNVLLASRKGAARVARDVAKVIKDEFGLDIDVVARSRDELAATVAANPFADVADDPKRLQVVFLAADPPAAAIKTLAEADLAPERVEVIGREVFAWHANGIQKSPLGKLLADSKLRLHGTARNWNTVTKLLELADA